jgi:hypothetical protein
MTEDLRSSWWSRRVARLPDRGTLLVATDLQGNLRDWERLKSLHGEELAKDRGAVLALTGDLVHGPSPELEAPGAWPKHLGTAYADRSKELVLDFIEYSARAPALALLGNHEHAHIGGPVVAKFYPDEAAILDRSLGNDKERVHAFFRSMPLIAVSRAGVVLTHAAPRATEHDLAAFERLRYEGYTRLSIHDMAGRDTLGALLWARSAEPKDARALLEATTLDGDPSGFVAYGHDVVREGYDKVGDEQICFSTSYGLFDEAKVYLRLDLSHRYRSVDELRDGIEILKLYPNV